MGNEAIKEIGAACQVSSSRPLQAIGAFPKSFFHAWSVGFRKPWSVPAGALDGQCDLRQARIGPAIPGKAVGEHRDPRPFHWRASSCPASTRRSVGSSPPHACRHLRVVPHHREDVGARHPGRRDARLGADRPEHETRDGAEGEGTVVAEARSANGPEAKRHRDRAGARFRRRVRPALTTVPLQSPMNASHFWITS